MAFETPWARRRREDREDRQAYLNAMQAMVTSMTTMVTAFLDSFKINEPPTVRWFDEAENAKRYLAARELTGEDDVLGQYRALARKLDDFDAGE